MAKKGLGRGLGALLDSGNDAPVVVEEVKNNNGVQLIDVLKIEPNRQQPRQYFDEAQLEELAESVRSYGIIQPIIVKDCGGYYSIIAGERRFRAARLANMETVPAIIKDYTELDILQIALIENIQRQDLTPIEEATCYKRLIDDFFFSQEDIATKIGKHRTAVSNAVRLLELDERVQELVAAGRLTVSHARCLLAIKDKDIQYATAGQVVEEELSVRTTESLVTALLTPPVEKALIELPDEAPNESVYSAYRQVEDELKTLLGTKVQILQGKKKGKIEIEYHSPEDLDRLVGLFKANIEL